MFSLFGIFDKRNNSLRLYVQAIYCYHPLYICRENVIVYFLYTQQRILKTLEFRIFMRPSAQERSHSRTMQFVRPSVRLSFKRLTWSEAIRCQNKLCDTGTRCMPTKKNLSYRWQTARRICAIRNGVSDHFPPSKNNAPFLHVLPFRLRSFCVKGSGHKYVVT